LSIALGLGPVPAHETGVTTLLTSPPPPALPSSAPPSSAAASIPPSSVSLHRAPMPDGPPPVLVGTGSEQADAAMKPAITNN
jgi:hypothetical protein